MAIRVLIERTVETGQEARVQQILTELRSRAMQVRGYISGETLRDINNPHRYMVISTWNSLEDWKNWEGNADRKRLRDELNRVLRSTDETTIYGHI